MIGYRDCTLTVFGVAEWLHCADLLHLVDNFAGMSDPYVKGKMILITVFYFITEKFG